jgi:hypothetical protein
MVKLNGDSCYLDFLIDPKRGDRIRWTWQGPLRELWFDQFLKSKLEWPGSKKSHEIYPEFPAECTASDFIEAISGALSSTVLEWRSHGSDPGRLACLSFMGGPNLHRDSDLDYSRLGYFQGEDSADPWSSTNTWLYPEGDHWVLSVTTMICPLNYPDEEDATALRMAKEAYERNYKILYQHSIETKTLEQWREQARAFMRELFSRMEKPGYIP